MATYAGEYGVNGIPLAVAALLENAPTVIADNHFDAPDDDACNAVFKVLVQFLSLSK